MSSVKEGDRISNYLLEEQVGVGSFGEVWRARHHVFGEQVAIKVPTDPQYVRNLQREGVVVHGLRHPNIVRAIDLDPFAAPPYFIMEFVDGPSVREVIDHYKDTLPIPAAVSIMRGILNAMIAAHEGGLIHRDLKPANVLVAHPLEEIATVSEQAIKVTDFGLGRVGGATAHSIMQSGSLITEDGRSISGTIAYMSPEQREGKEIDGRSDLYSCGIVLFELLTGVLPPGSDLPSDLRPDVSGHLDTVFQRSYTSLERRFRSGGEMVAALAGGAPTTDTIVPPHVVTRGTKLHCPSCDFQVHAEDQFCIRCGQQLVESVPRCPACSAFPRRNDRFCIRCGADLQSIAK
jgi:serine/threonine protein kinase